MLCLLPLQAAASSPSYYGAPYYMEYVGISANEFRAGPFPSVQEALDSYYQDVVNRLGYEDGCTLEIDEGLPIYAFFNEECSYHWDAPAAKIDAEQYDVNDKGKNLGDPCCNAVGNPINAGNGNKYQIERDYLGKGLTFDRYYNSANTFGSNIGKGWRHTYDRKIDYHREILIDGSVSEWVVLTRQDGKIFLFVKHDESWVPDDNVKDKLFEQNGPDGQPAYWVYFDTHSNAEETYDKNGNLDSINYQDGLRVNLTYSSTKYGTGMGKVLSSVRDSSGREITFTYNKDNYITSISLPDGNYIKYKYKNSSCDPSGLLLSGVEYQDGSSKDYGYDKVRSCSEFSDAYLSEIKDESGSPFASFLYEAEADVPYDPSVHVLLRRAIASSHAEGTDKHEFTYQSNGDVRVTYPEGSAALLSFVNRKGSILLSSVDAPCNPVCKQPARVRNYDDDGYLTSLLDFNGNITETRFDNEGLLVEKVGARAQSSQRTTNFTWDNALRMPLSQVVRDAEGRIVSGTAWSYNDRGQVLAYCELDAGAVGGACAPSGQVPAGVRRTTYNYCEAVDGAQCPREGLLLTATGPRTDVAQVVRYSYYMTNSSVDCGTPGAGCYRPGDLRTITDAAGHVVTIASYDADGQITRMIEANGVNTDMTYTPRGWLASRSVGGAITRFTYTPYGAVQTITDPDNVVTTYGYDTAHRLVKITDALGNYIQYSLNAAGNKTAEQVYDASGMLHKSLTRSYNTLGQLTKIVDGLSNIVFDASASNSYDANGNLVQSVDGLGIRRKLGYDALNRLAQTLDNYNGTDSTTANSEGDFNFDTLDRLDGISDPDHLNTVYAYDGLSNLVRHISPDSGSAKNAFDAAGNLIQSTDARNITRAYTYDALNRVTSLSTGNLSEAVTYAYDEANAITGCSASYPVGRLTRVVENSVTTTYCYDARGNVTTKLQSFRTYSVGGDCAPGKMCHQNMGIEGWKTITDSTRYTYTQAGRLRGTTYPSGTQAIYTRDRNGRIQSVAVTPSNDTASELVSNVTYLPFGPITGYTLGNGNTVTRHYDANYRLNYIFNTSFMAGYQHDAMGHIVSRDDETGLVETYQYDPLGRLASGKDASGNVRESYTYSKAGDRLSKIGSGQATGTYGYQTGTHRLTAIGNTARTYDANGNTTGESVSGETWAYGYDGRDRMTVVQRNGSTVASYTYNVFGERIAKTVTQPQAISERFVYNEQSQLVAELGNTNRDYIWLDELPVGVVDNTDSNSTLNYVLADGLGTPRAIQDASGSSIWRWQIGLNSFGELPAISSSGYVYNLRFPGQYFDSETGLHYNVHRDYDPATGRYRQVDPIGHGGGQWSLYAYASSNPISYVDPTGLATTIIITSDYGIGSHAALYTDHGFENGPFIYDPAGSYPGANPNIDARGSGDLFTDKDASLSAYTAFQRSTGSNVTTYTFDTTPDQEAAIEKATEVEGGAQPFFCADHVSNAIRGIGPFISLPHYYRPGGLGSALGGLPGVIVRQVP